MLKNPYRAGFRGLSVQLRKAFPKSGELREDRSHAKRDLKRANPFRIASRAIAMREFRLPRSGGIRLHQSDLVTGEKMIDIHGWLPADVSGSTSSLSR